MLYVVPTSLLSAAGAGGGDHLGRWFEADASKRAAKYFDKRYGRGANGYFLNSPNHFDIRSFTTEGDPSPYNNHRESGYNERKGFPIDSVGHNWFDLMPGYVFSKILLGIF